MNVNLIDFIFINFIVTITILGALINFIEPYLPALITQTFRYGKHSYKGEPNKLAQMFEIPKSYFKHFYTFALIWSTGIMYLVSHVYLLGNTVPTSVLWFLELLCGTNREVKTNATTTYIAVALLYIQCIRRFYETNFVQIFSTSSKMNITHYLVGYFHYFGAFLAILSQAQGFVKETKTVYTAQSSEISLYHYLAIALFIYCWWHQYQSNLILVNLRKDGKGDVVTQRHLMPMGGYFKYVSSPHMFFEVMIYVTLYLIIHNNSSWLFVVCWVITNQIENAWLTQKWYVETFVDYPPERRAIFPRFL